MPKFSRQGQYVLSMDALGFPSFDWGWLTDDLATGYRYDLPLAGRYTCQFPARTFAYAGDDGQANRFRFFAANGRWLVDLTTGPLDSDGRTWPADWSACGLGDRGEQVFVLKSTFDTGQERLIIQDWSGANQRTVPVPGFVNDSVTMHGGYLMWTSTTGPRNEAGDLIGPRGANQRFGVGPDGRRWGVGYVAQWGLCVWPLGEMRGWNLSLDDYDNYPDVFARAADMLEIVSAETTADSRVRTYRLNTSLGIASRDGREWPCPPVDLLRPPVEPLPDLQPVPSDYAPALCGPFFASSDAYGYYDTPGTGEVLIRGTFLRMARRRPVISGTDCQATVPTQFLCGIWTGFEGAEVSEIARAAYVDARAVAEVRDVPLLVYWDRQGEWPEWALDVFVRREDIPVVSGYPVKRDVMEPVEITLTRLRDTIERLRRRYARVALARPCYTQSGNWPWAHVFAMQGPITELVRRYRLWADLWFAWARDPQHALMAGPAELRDYVGQLAAVAAVNIWQPDPTPDPVPDPPPVQPSPSPVTRRRLASAFPIPLLLLRR